MKKAVAVGGGGGGGKGGTAATDLLVCFPARQHLALMPKPICSPSRTTMDKAAAARRRQLQLPGGGAGAAASAGKARGSSPMFRGSKARQRAEEDEEEPRSPKVTCAGQIKVGRPKKAKPGGSAAATKRNGKDDAGGSRSWITVAEEIERLHGRRKKAGWLETLGMRRDALPFLGGALRSLRHRVRCFGSLHGAAVGSNTDSEQEDGDAEEHGGERRGASSVFSKWLMVLEDGQEPLEEDCAGDDEGGDQEDDDEGQTDEGTNAPSAPPPNALLLMRCRSAPAKGLSLSRRETGGLLLPGDVEQEKATADAVPGDGGETEEDRAELVFMSSAPGFLKLSLDIAKETWVVGGVDALARSRSCKR
jgi:hypothetical protein